MSRKLFTGGTRTFRFSEGACTKGNMWANINPPGGMNRAHQHPNSLWSGVYYIKAPKNCGHLKIDDPRSVACMSRPKQKEGEKPARLFRETHYEPIAGRMYYVSSMVNALC